MRAFRVERIRHIALIAVLCLGGINPALIPSAAASGVGSECCADLDARISELEATAARKGAGNLSLRVYGQVNRALMMWDDGFDSNAYVTDNDASSSRLGVIGEAWIGPGWLTGYRVEMEFKDAASNEVFNGPGGDEGFAEQDLRIRHSYVYIGSDDLGRISLGQQSPATDDITIINLGAQMSDGALHYNNDFALRLDLAFGLSTDLTWAHFAHSVDSMRGDFLRYDSPAIGGFVLSAAAGEDDVWDVALRYRADLNSVQVAAGIGYLEWSELDYSDLRGSASAIHKPTGLFLSGAGGFRDDRSGVVGEGDEANFYFAQLGLKRRLLPYGETTIYGEFGIYNDYTVGRLLQADLGVDQEFETWGCVTDSEVRRWGVGIEQAFDASALLLYAQYHNYEAAIAGMPMDDNGNLSDLIEALPVEPWSAVVVGARIQF